MATELVISSAAWLEVTYVASAILFIFGILGLSKQSTARAGNLVGIVGMVIAMIGVYIYINDEDEASHDYVWWAIPIACVVGGAIGSFAALKVKMTGMPQMVGYLNAFGGLAAALESIGLYFAEEAERSVIKSESAQQMIFLIMGIIVGTVTFFGSIWACLKLDGKIGSPKIPKVFNIILGVLLLASSVGMYLDSYYNIDSPKLTDHIDDYNGIIFMIALIVLSLLYSICFVMPIGGADMPVVISVLNAFSGMSGCIAGFMVKNNLLIITGALVASSGSILSFIMCKAMNRSLMNVLAGGFGEAASSGPKKPDTEEKKEHKLIDTDGLAEKLMAAKKVLIVPGYGLAVARGQFDVATMTTLLRKHGVDVGFGIHPVAGRLPGHMNVLLAEASIPHDIVYEMDEVNPEMADVDVVLVVGANDTVNPIAEEPDSAIAGMPVIKVWESKSVVVLKRSMRFGYAAIPNPLFYKENTEMHLGDAKKSVENLVTALKNKGFDGTGAVNLNAAKKKKEEKKIDFSALPIHKTFGVPREIGEDETRVAMTPAVASKMRQMGFGVKVEAGAGSGARFMDEEYVANGAEIVDADEAWNQAIVLKVLEPTEEEMKRLSKDQILVCYSNARAKEVELHKYCVENGVTLMGMDAVPRTTAAQKLDSLSSMGKISGYRAVIEAAHSFGSFFTAQITAAGKYPPCKVLVIGAGVAGLEAVGVAKALGAEVACFDTRLVCKEQVESMGARFLEVTMEEDGEGAGGYAKVMSKEYIEAEMAMFHEEAKDTDIVITTANIPGRRAPILWEQRHVEAMKTGSVVVDLAAMTGGNCEMTKPGEVILHNGVTIIGHKNLPARMARQSSEMYAMNMYRLLEHMGKAENLTVNLEDPVVRPMLVTYEGKHVYQPPSAPMPSAGAAAKEDTTVAAAAKPEPKKISAICGHMIGVVCIGICCLFAGIVMPDSFAQQMMVFALACVVGYNSIWNVASALHTPLMSVTNAISGVVVLGGMVQLLGEFAQASVLFSIAAVFIASINIFGGFVVTHRMLKMFISGN
eukprot:TRINITY_DN64764_c0_g1_i1.p1 TRINITY_DN64764_c0_g1~~TRINITY_DN64764_c0_g1_i1.p1  ORF type:complete len:1037 (-),score=430.10 TRINITY_DN64764_c0_g1_i1:368-3478(-)